MSATKPPTSKPGCSIDGCEKPARRGSSLCPMHYARVRRHGDPHYVRQVRLCSVDGCGQKHQQHGYCVVHYARWKKHGNPKWTRRVRTTCSVEGCDRKHQARGFCRTHYNRWRLGQTPSCTIEGCSNRQIARGLCDTHYRQLRAGETPGRRPTRPNLERFLEKVDKQDNGCWVWTASRKNGRYGTFSYNPLPYRVRRGTGTSTREMMAHRFAYQHFVGPIPEDHDIDHLCGNTLCVNPDHLEAVTPWENRRRAARRR
jgi:hypothetical protein